MFWNKRAAGKIFINYRRDDARGVAGRLGDTLGEYFGDDRVFRDVGGIDGGANFEEVLQQTVSSADAVIVLIGPDWLTMTGANGLRRLDDPDDWVAREVADALQRQLPVFPVLIEDTDMPRADDLPDSLKPLARLNAVSICDERWDADATRLAKIVAFDIPGSATEMKLDLVRLAISLALFLSVTLTTGIVAWNLMKRPFATDAHAVASPGSERQASDTGTRAAQLRKPLEYWQSGLTPVAILASSIGLFIFAPLVDTSKRRFIYASGLLGAVGSLICFLGLLLINSVDQAEETRLESIAMFLGSTVVATGMLALMNLSGFRPK